MNDMQPEQTLNRPSIVITVFPHAGDAVKLREIQAGMEEEGVPCSLTTGADLDAVTLAHQAAFMSALGVGVGIRPDGLCIHYQKLPAHQPLFVLTGAQSAAEWRRFGYNAARLVKGLPFKGQETAETVPGLDITGLYAQVREMVLKILPELVQGHGEVNTWSKMP